MMRRKFQTSWEVVSDRGLNLTREPGPPSRPSKAGSTCASGTASRVPGLWSLRCPVIQAFSVFNCRLSGRTCMPAAPRVSLPALSNLYPDGASVMGVLSPGQCARALWK